MVKIIALPLGSVRIPSPDGTLDHAILPDGRYTFDGEEFFEQDQMEDQIRERTRNKRPPTGFFFEVWDESHR